MDGRHAWAYDPSTSLCQPRGRHWTLTIAPGQTVTKWRSFPYACCGTYTVTDFVHANDGTQLAKATATFTFA